MGNFIAQKLAMERAVKTPCTDYEKHFEKIYRAVVKGDMDKVSRLLRSKKYTFKTHWGYMSDGRLLWLEDTVFEMLHAEDNYTMRMIWEKHVYGPIQLLELAVLTGRPKVVNVVLRSGIDEVCNRLYAEGKSHRCSTPLHFLALTRGTKEDLTEIALMLRDRGYDMNLTIDFCEMTPLHLACTYTTNTTAIQVLIEAGCDVTRKSSFGYTALNKISSSTKFTESDVKALLKCFFEHGYGLDLNEEASYLFLNNHCFNIKLRVVILYGFMPWMLDEMALCVLKNELLKPEIDLKLLIAVMELGVRLDTLQVHESITPDQQKALKLQNNVLPLQRLAANAIRTTLQPNFYFRLMRLSGVIPKNFPDYIMMKNIIQI